jgi:hypothetical protein
MEERGKPLHKRTLRTTYKKANKPAHRGDKNVRKQMAYVGSVYTVAPWERSPHDILDEVHRKATAKNRPSRSPLCD